MTPPPPLAQLATSILNYGGRAVRGGQLFGEQTAVAMTKKYFKGLQGVENIYTQHKPYLIDLVQVRAVTLLMGPVRAIRRNWGDARTKCTLTDTPPSLTAGGVI